MKSIEFSQGKCPSNLLTSYQGFRVKHMLSDSPLFRLDRLVELASSMCESQVEYNAGNVALDQDPDKTPHTGLSIEETIKHIEDCGSWMVLKNVETDPEYKALLDKCLDEIYAQLPCKTLKLSQREAFIFISSPNSTTPYHFDPEHNFLLQIRGKKSFALFPSNDRKVITENSLEERYYRPETPRNLHYEEAYQQYGEVHEMNAGDGLYVPVNAPHWVQTHDDISISFSITFRSPESNRVLTLYRLNALLRDRFKINPKAVGQNLIRDKVVYGIYCGVRNVVNAFRRVKRSLYSTSKETITSKH